MNQLELNLISKLIENPSLILTSKVSVEYLTDVFAKHMYKEIAKSIAATGEFIPGIHLKNLVNDQILCDKFVKCGYDIDFSSIDNVVGYVNKSKNQTKFETIEKHITDEYIKRKLIKLSEKIAEKTEKIDFRANDFLREASTAIDKLLYGTENDLETMSVDDMWVNEISYQNSGEVASFVPSGILVLDKIAGGTAQPSLNCVLGTSKSGKSLSLYSSLLARLKANRTCLFATIEINAEETYRKIISAYSGIDYIKIQQKNLTLEEKDIYLAKFKEFTELYRDKFFIYYNRSGCSPKDIEIYSNLLAKSGFNVDDIFVDYIALLTSSDPSKKSTVDSMLSLPKELRILSQKTNTAVFTAQQLSLSAESKSIDEITLDDIWYSKTLAHECSSLIIVKRDKEADTNVIKTKMLPSRLAWDDTVYTYVNTDLNKCFLGDDIVESFGNVSW